MGILKLHQEDGSEIFVAADDIQAFYPKTNSSSAIVFKSHGQLIVKETADEINLMLKGG